MSDRIIRVTSFKIPKKEDQQKMIEIYRGLEPKKNGKPYILRSDVGIAEDTPRTEGYTVVNKTEFASMDDMNYWDKEDEAHHAVRAGFKAQGVGIENITTVIFYSQISGGTELA